VNEADVVKEIKKLYAEAGADVEHWRTRATRDVVAAIQALLARLEGKPPAVEYLKVDTRDDEATEPVDAPVKRGPGRPKAS
jgi:hypothetical protein